MNIAVYCSARSHIADQCFADAQTLGHWIGSNGHMLVYGGLKRGLMDTIAHATAQAGGRVMGVVPQSRVDNQHPDNYVSIPVESLHERKQIMEENADAFVALDGGYGTLDEVMSALATMSFFNAPKPLILLNRDGLYTPLRQMLENMCALHLTEQKVIDRITFAPDINAVIEALKNQPR